MRNTVSSSRHRLPDEIFRSFAESPGGVFVTRMSHCGQRETERDPVQRQRGPDARPSFSPGGPQRSRVRPRPLPRPGRQGVSRAGKRGTTAEPSLTASAEPPRTQQQTRAPRCPRPPVKPPVPLLPFWPLSHLPAASSRGLCRGGAQPPFPEPLLSSLALPPAADETMRAHTGGWTDGHGTHRATEVPLPAPPKPAGTARLPPRRLPELVPTGGGGGGGGAGEPAARHPPRLFPARSRPRSAAAGGGDAGGRRRAGNGPGRAAQQPSSLPSLPSPPLPR